ncbi:MAG: hypothetical protein NT061_04540 [Spirochaetes bacterium]|nr:hypothetical protein [Spirochaetota bacterium]
MSVDSASLVRLKGGEVFALRKSLGRSLLAEVGSFEKEDVVCLTLLAGAGTRWVKSLCKAKSSLRDSGDAVSCAAVSFPLAAPRGLFPVRNFLGTRGKTIPLAAYALDAFKGLGRHLIVIRGWEREINESVLAPLGIPASMVSFHTQVEGPQGKVLGHGDAAMQAMELWKDSKYVLVNFGGDANSPLTALFSLLVLKGLEAEDKSADILMPVARIDGAAYPIFVDKEGLPRSFGHDKLGGKRMRSGISRLKEPKPSGFTNVGIRAYRTAALAEAIVEIKGAYWREGIGWNIPGNDPEAHEFALDNVDSFLAGRGRARILPVAAPEELTPAKSFDELGRFEAAVEKVRLDWDDFRSALDSQEPPYRRSGEGIDRP